MRYAAVVALVIVGLIAADNGVETAPFAFVIAAWLALNEK